MEQLLIWKMVPVLMAVLWVLSTFKFKLIKRGQINAWLGISIAAINSNLYYYGFVIYANIITIVLVSFIVWRSMHRCEGTNS